jgi:hypothetical protein
MSLREVQRIDTSGARAVETFLVDGLELLAIAQLAKDVPGQQPHMNAGDSNTDLLLLRRVDGRYVPFSTLPAPGGEDAEFFTIGKQAFLAIASIRTGSGPYELATTSELYVWKAGCFVPFQTFDTFAAKQWRHWQIADRHFLGLAQGVRLPGTDDQNRDSVVFEWDGSSFVEQQRIPSQWAYNWHPFEIDGVFFVAHAEHLDASVLYRWDGAQLQPHQVLSERGGRAFATFESEGEFYLLVASLLEPPTLMHWENNEFKGVQVLEGLGARELTVLNIGDRLFVIRINFILGTPADPDPVMDSQIYEWRLGSLQLVAEFPTTGGTDVAVIPHTDPIEFVVSNSLSPELRFSTKSVVYSLSMESL